MEVRFHSKKQEEEEGILYGTSDNDSEDSDVPIDQVRMNYKVKGSFNGRRLRRLLVAVGIVVLVLIAVVIGVKVGMSTSKAPDSSKLDNSGKVIQSPSDKRKYFATRLSNGLRVLLIQDKITDYAAASMDVAVGNYEDPNDVLGLAHFCEHMLFMGTKKYPSEDNYSSFISEHGGYDNAYTSTENTNYYFRVAYDQLRPTLDRFLQFFVAPLFSENATFREMHAVDSEYRKDIPQDAWRYWELLKATASPKHPFSRFEIGSLQTLDRPDIRQRLLQFHHDHYTVNRLHLAVLGRESIEQQLAWVQEMASAIPDRTSQRAVIKDPPFPPSLTARQVWVCPNGAEDFLKLYFPIPPVQSLYRSAPTYYLTWLLGHESTGSLLYVMRRRGWALALYASLELDGRDSAVLGLNIHLASDGLNHIDDITSLIFQYVRLVSSSGVTKAIWEKQQALHNISFQFRTSVDAADYVQQLSAKMRYMNDSRDLLHPPSRAVWDPTAIRRILSCLTPRNLMLHLASHLNISYDKTESYFQIKYKVAPISEARLRRWETDSLESDLGLPTVNPFIPSNFSLVLVPNPAPSLPILVLNDPGMKVWWLIDHVFRDPRLGLKCTVFTPFASTTAKDAASLSLLAALVDDSVTGIKYDANLAGYSIDSIFMTSSGFHLGLNGYSDPKSLLFALQVLTRAIAHPTSLYSSERFNLTKSAFIESLESFATSKQAYQHALHYVEPLLLQKNYFSNGDILAATLPLSQFDMQIYLIKLLSTFSLACLVHGNVNENQAISYVRAISKELPDMPTFPETLWTAGQQVMLHAGNPQMVRLLSLDQNNPNSAITLVYQIGPKCSAKGTAMHPSNCSAVSLRNTVLLDLVTLAIKDPCFHQLRTVDKLGYVVACLSGASGDILSFQVVIQSAQFSPTHLQNRAELFLSSFRDTLTTLTHNAFWWSELRASARKSYMEKDLTRVAATKRLFSEISARTFLFTFKEQLLTTLDNITSSSEMVNFYDTYLLQPESQRKLSIQLYGKGQERPANGTDVQDFDEITAWKHNHTFYTLDTLQY